MRNSDCLQTTESDVSRPESAPSQIGHITLDAKQAGKRRTGNPFAPFDEAGAGDGLTANLNGHEAGNSGYRQGEPKREPRQSSTLQIILHGRLTQDPEVRYTPSGAAVASFSVAINRKYRKGEKKELTEAVTFVPVRFFGKAAEQAGEHLAKGRAVLIDGELRASEWKGEGGETRRMLYVAAQKIIYLGKANGKPAAQEGPTDTADADVPF